jgi:thioredoxin 1
MRGCVTAGTGARYDPRVNDLKGEPVDPPEARAMSDGGERSVETVSASAFDEDRLHRAGLWAVAFVADWCPFCREFLPRFEARATSSGAGLLFADVTDEASPLWEEFDLEVVPTVVAFRDGTAIGRLDGILGRGIADPALATFLDGLAGR